MTQQLVLKFMDTNVQLSDALPETLLAFLKKRLISYRAYRDQIYSLGQRSIELNQEFPLLLSPLKGLRDKLDTLIKEENQTLINQVVSWVWDQFNVRISLGQLLKYQSGNFRDYPSEIDAFLRRELTFDDITKLIIDQAGFDLQSKGHETVVKQFKNCVNFYGTSSWIEEQKRGRHKAILQNKAVRLLDYASYDTWSFNSATELSWRSFEQEGRISCLFRAIALFDTGLPNHAYALNPDTNSRKIEPGTHYPIGPVNLRFFKNRRVDLIFKTASDAQRFWDFYHLSDRED